MTAARSSSGTLAGRHILAAMDEVLPSLVTPVLAIDLDAVTHNIASMLRFAGTGRWRPHIKTVKQRRIVQLLLDAGVTTLKCATPDELTLILDTAVEQGSDVDVLLAYPPVGPVLDRVVEQAARVPKSLVRVLADHPAHLVELTARCLHAPGNVSVLLDVDVGMARTGASAEAWHSADTAIADAGSRLSGLHGYEGHLRWSQREAAMQGYESLRSLADTLQPEQANVLVTSGTHSFHHALEFSPFAEDRRHQVSPGTLIFNDLRSSEATALLGLQQAAFVLSRVISTPGPGRITLDAGSKALNPDCPAPGCAVVGYPGWAGQTASEEHRPLRRVADDGATPQFGEVVAVVPEHVCTTVNLFREAFHVRAGHAPARHPIEAASRTHGPQLPQP